MNRPSAFLHSPGNCWLAVLLLALLQTAGMARTSLTGRVVGVHDGDTLTLLTEGNKRIRVRLEGIDAPELGQPFGKTSKQSLSDMVFGKDIRVVSSGTDEYGRTLGQIYVEDLWVNLALVERGMAWHYTHYSNDGRLQSAESKARREHLGLWQDRKPVPPWDWRHHASKR